MVDIVTVVLSGCDADTSLTVSVSPEELSFLKDLAKRSEVESEYGCMPVLRIEDPS